MAHIYGMTEMSFIKGVKPYNVKKVVAKSGTKPGKVGTIFYITQGDIDHVKTSGRHPEFDDLSNDELLALIDELQSEPDDTVDYTRKGYTDYYYDDIEVGNKYMTIIFRVSDSNPGRIISIFEEVDN